MDLCLRCTAGTVCLLFVCSPVNQLSACPSCHKEHLVHNKSFRGKLQGSHRILKGSFTPSHVCPLPMQVQHSTQATTVWCNKDVHLRRSSSYTCSCLRRVSTWLTPSAQGVPTRDYKGSRSPELSQSHSDMARYSSIVNDSNLHLRAFELGMHAACTCMQLCMQSIHKIPQSLPRRRLLSHPYGNMLQHSSTCGPTPNSTPNSISCDPIPCDMILCWAPVMATPCAHNRAWVFLMPELAMPGLTGGQTCC